ncbi:regulatory protein, luxR family [Agromyces sp. CF514]|uniref:ATP-binding protein n=1 Tax=Agromyces sp. CF514 TaxID=1881031 RepID=UPI0008E2B4FF|nr:LuxR C-terminal-related transcriptional regulator [Agromyces sp. CF514]SFR71448.1 regulatory protein, luxR family [Agromyces sp. CF514]
MSNPRLTPRERAVLAAIERRLNNPEIASEMFISVRTVESHVASLRRKLDAETRAELVTASIDLRSASVRVPDNAFIGREADLGRLAAAVRARHWATVTGPGGVGKTRLALEFARASTVEGAPVVVELEHAEPADVVARISRALDLESAPGVDALDAVATSLGSRPYLLVLDNVDRVGAAVGEVVARATAHAPGLRVLTTSRTPIGDPAEAVIALAPLPADGAGSPAVAVFLERLGPGAVASPPTSDEREQAARICARLDGLPLALELAASVARHLSLAELAERLEHDFATLDRAAPGGRHRTLETAFEWSWDLLDADEQHVLRRLAALPRTFDMDLALAVTHPGAGGTVMRLLDRSLIVSTGGTPRRFRLLEVLRDFVRARTDDDLTRDVLERHATFIEAIVVPFARRARLDDSLEAMHASEILCPEVNAAVRWARAARHPTALPLASSLGVGVDQYGSDVDSVRTLAAVARDAEVIADATPQQLLALGIALTFLDLDAVAELAERASAVAVEDRDRLAALHLAGMAEAYLEHEQAALERLAEAETLAEQLGDHWELAATRQMRGVALRRSSPERAMEDFAAAMRDFGRAGDAMHVNNARYMIALTAAEAGIDLDRAAELAAECVDYARASHNEHELAHAAMVQQLIGRADPELELDELVQEFRRFGDARCRIRILLLQAERAPATPTRRAILLEALDLAQAVHDEHRESEVLALLSVAAPAT